MNTFDYNKLSLPQFDFLRNEMSLRTIIIGIARADKQNNLEVNKSNSIIVDNKNIYISDSAWNKIYAFMLRSAGQKNIDINDQEQINSILMKNKVTDTNIYFKYISTVITKIQSGEDKNAYIKILKTIFKDTKSSEEFLSVFSQSFIMHGYRRRNSKNDTDDIEFNFTASAHKYGLTICKYFIDQNKYFVNILTKLASKKDLKAISVNDINQFTRYINAVLKDDIDEEKIFYKQWDNFNYNNKTLISLIRNYILNIVYDQYTRNNIPFPELYTILKEYSHKYNNRVLYDNINEMFIKLGSIILDVMIDSNIYEKVTERFTNTKSQLVIKVHHDIIDNLMDLFSFNRPYLVEANSQWLSDNQDEDMIYKIAYENKTNLIHTNPEIELDVKADCYLLEHKPLISYTIDRMYLYYFLNFLYDFYTEPGVDALDILSTLYDINYPELCQQFQDNVEATSIVESIMLFALDFNVISRKEIQKKINDYRGKDKYILIDLLNKINSYKIYIVGLLKDALLYEIFSYFISEIFLDTRARTYQNLVSMNVLGFPNAKIFVKVFSKNHAKFNYEQIQKIVSKELIFAEQKQKILSMTLKEYKKADKELRYNYIYDFFNSEQMSQTEFSNLYYHSDLLDYHTLSLIKHTLKKSKRTFIIHSMLLLERYPTNNTLNYFELDATCSGLQMVSMLLNSNHLAILSNLIGNVKSDIYTLALNEFQIELHNIFSLPYIVRPYLYQDNIFLEIDNTQALNLNKEEFLLCTDPHKRFLAFCNMDINKSGYAPNLINLIYDDLSNNKIVIPDFENLIWVLSENDMKLSTWVTITVPFKQLQFLMLLRKAFKLWAMVSQNLWVNSLLNDRELFKKAIMTYFYNATSFGRKEHFMKLLWKSAKYLEKSFSNVKNITYLSTIADRYFSHFMTTRVPDSTKMIELSKYLGEQKKPIIINNSYFKIKFNPKVNNKQIIQMPSYKNQRGSQLMINKETDITDSKTMKQRFNPNYIHSMDASIVHHYYRRLLKMNLDLKGIYHICFHTNHDTFANSLSPFLKIILEDCYRELYESNYIQTLENIDPLLLDKIKNLVDKNKLDLITLNPYFVK